MNHARSLFLLSVLATATSLAAQAPPPPRVVGLTFGAPMVPTIDPGTCQYQLCNGAVLPPAANPLAGGTAHDATDGATWITTGLFLAKVDTRNQCLVVCPPQPVPIPAGANFATGLAFSEAQRVLWISYDNNVIARFGVQGCQLLPQGFCQAPVALQHMVTGLATDDINGFLFYASSPIGGGGPAFGLVYQAPIATPCNPFCRFPIPSCTGALFTQITGLGWEPCRQLLYATDGVGLVGSQLLPNCQVNPAICCPGPFAAPLIGLDVMPSNAVPMGVSCTQGACPVCPAMRHDTVGDATIGNPFFALTLRNAPSGAVSILVISIGQFCTPPGFPLFFCGPILTPPPLTTFGGFPTGGTGGCSGGILFPVPLPPNPALCGMPMSSQFVGLCPANPLTDNFVSNCLSWMITGS